MHKVAAIIGSRQTPSDVQILITKIASWLAENNYYIRTGAAEGADWAAGLGAKDKTIFYLPWSNYQREKLNVTFDKNYIVGCERPSQEAMALAEKYHPNWAACKPGARALHGRNMHIISGIKLDKPVEFVICWTADGLASGGAGQAMRYAKGLNIPIINLFHHNYEGDFMATQLYIGYSLPELKLSI